MATKEKAEHTEQTAHEKAKHTSQNASSEAKTSAATHDQRAANVTAKNASQADVAFMEEHGDELSKSTLRAKWIHSPNEHEDHPGQTLATRSHEVIQQWAQERQATPETVPGTEHGDHAGVLRFNFPGHGGQKLEEIGWDEFFKTFDERELVFLFQEHQKAGNQSNFFRFDSPLREDA